MLAHYSLSASGKILRAIFIAITLHIMRSADYTTKNNKKLMAFIYNFIFYVNYIAYMNITLNYTRWDL